MFKDLLALMARDDAWRAANPGPLIWVTNLKAGALFREWCPDGPAAPFHPTSYHYIGRQMRGWEWRGESALANPYRLEDGGRTSAFTRYRSWLIERFTPETPQWAELMEILKASLDPRGIALGCWCAPQPCHGQIIAAAVQSMYDGGWRPKGDLE